MRASINIFIKEYEKISWNFCKKNEFWRGRNHVLYPVKYGNQRTVLSINISRAMLEEEEKWMFRQSEALSEKRAITLISEELFLDVSLCYRYGPSCSKLTTWLVNETLKFQTLIFQICQYFLLKKCEKLLSFCQQKISVYLVIKS